MLVVDCMFILIDLRPRRSFAGGTRGSALGSVKAGVACTMCMCVTYVALASPLFFDVSRGSRCNLRQIN